MAAPARKPPASTDGDPTAATVPPVSPDAHKTVPAAPGYKQPQEILRAYVAFQREKLGKASAAHGLNRSGAAAIAARDLLDFLTQLESLALWLEQGQPGPGAILNEDERKFWTQARDRGMPVPAEILAQLS